MFVPPSFEPTTPREPQWFPRPITDSIESSLDLIERLEEDRKRRLRNIANVPARIPIGLGGIEDRGHAGSGSGIGGHQSPKPNSNIVGGCNDYARYRYYPPFDAVPSSSSGAGAATGTMAMGVVDTSSMMAALHNSYTVGTNDSHRRPRSIPSSSVTTRNRIYRRGATPRSSSSAATAAAAASTTTNAMMRGGRRNNDDDSDEDSMHVDETETTYHHQYLQRISNQSFHSSSSSVQFTSPPLDPHEGGGGGRIRRSSLSSAGAAAIDIARRHNDEREVEMNTTLSDNVALTTTEWITPPAISEAHSTPGHGQGGDVYSQRMDASQRRRRRWWDEVNNND